MHALVNVVLPVFAIILTGYLIGRFKVLGEASSEALNGFVYYVALPVLLFHSVARVPPEKVFVWGFIATYAAAGFATFAIGVLVSRLIFKRPLAENGLSGMSAVFGNTGYMGIPLAIVAFGDAAALPAIVATVLHGIIWVPLVLAMVEIDIRKGGGGRLGDIALSLVRNPMLVAPVAGILWSLTGIALPEPVDNFASILGAAAGPCALFALGMFLVGKPLHEGAGEVGSIVVLKLLFHPLITWFFAFHVFTLEPMWATVSVLMAALPAGANCYVLAQQYGRFVERSSAVILISTVLAVATVSALFTLPIMTLP